MVVTIRIVAEQAGVSPGTASRALRGHPQVSPDCMERVRAAAQRLGYRPLRSHSGRGRPEPLVGKRIAIAMFGIDRTLASLPVVAEAIHGAEEALAGLRRLTVQTISVSAEQIAAGRAARAARDAAAAAAGETVRRLSLRRQSRTINGLLDEPDFDATAVEIRADEKRRGQAAVSFDDEHLFVAFRVTDSTPWRNSGPDAKTIFLTGDSVDLQLGLDPTARPRRGRPVVGDFRIAIAPFGDDPVVMLYQPMVPGHKGPREAFISPVGRVEMDRVERIDSARVAVRRTETGYDLEAAIPLAALGMEFPVGRKIRGDVGILFSDDAGTKCLLRRYWSNRNTNIAADLPSETRLQPSAWGEVVIDD